MLVENVKNIEFEQSIVWLNPGAQGLPYVREGIMPVPYRAKAPAAWRGSGKIVAYATLQSGAPHVRPGRFLRRYWWLAAHDPYEGGGGPIEGVNPRSIAPGALSGPMTEEQWSRAGTRERQW